MKLLIVAATEGEVQPLPTAAKGGKWDVTTLVTGVGMVATAYALTRQLQSHRYDLVLQVGVAGSYNRQLSLGQVVFVTSEQYGDLGAEDHDEYIDIFEIGLLHKSSAPFNDGKLYSPSLPLVNKIALPQVSGLTVNTVSGNEQTIGRRIAKYGCDTESMEGAAFHYVCLQEDILFAQVRAISNYVTPRDKSQWKMKEAIDNLNKWLVDFIKILDA